MWNNYTVHMQNPDKIATRQAEADAVRLADEARARPAEGRVPGVLTSWATARIGKVVAYGTSGADRLRRGLATGLRAVRHDVALMGTHLQHLHRPHVALGHHRV
jgi:hypothetical protein